MRLRLSGKRRVDGSRRNSAQRTQETPTPTTAGSGSGNRLLSTPALCCAVRRNAPLLRPPATLAVSSHLRANCEQLMRCAHFPVARRAVCGRFVPPRRRSHLSLASCAAPRRVSSRRVALRCVASRRLFQEMSSRELPAGSSVSAPHLCTPASSSITASSLLNMCSISLCCCNVHSAFGSRLRLFDVMQRPTAAR